MGDIRFMKLLRPFTGTGAIFFPIGLPPQGTCEFATPACRRYCYAGSDSLFDFETNVPENEMWETYNYIITQPIKRVVAKIIQELDGLQTPILHWFGTGDCPTKDIDRISDIIDAVPKKIIQMGFTRNVRLWEWHKDIFALSIEDREHIRGREGMFSVPNYVEGISVMCASTHNVRGGYCGPITCRDLVESKLEHQINCRVCYKFRIGCFDKR